MPAASSISSLKINLGVMDDIAVVLFVGGYSLDSIRSRSVLRQGT